MIVLAIFAETTTPTFVFRRSRRHVNCSFSPTATGTGATRLRATVRFPTGRAATAAFAGAFTGALAVAAARVVVFVVSFGGRGAEPPDRFSAIRLTLSRSLSHHREEARDLSPRLREGAEVLQLTRGELELGVEDFLTRAAQLVR